jgi:cation diffusion facilitator family transporter
LQLVVVLFSGSVALLGDTLHNFADALTALPLWLAFVLERRPPNRRYTYGYGRAEDLAGVFIVAMIALSAVVAGWESVLRLLHPYRSGNLPWVIIAAVIGFLLNELVALYRIRVGRDIASAALVGDGLHARSDGLTSLAVLVGAIGVAAGFQRADPIVGLLITVAILFVLKSAARDIYDRLMDLVAPELWTRWKASWPQPPASWPWTRCGSVGSATNSVQRPRSKWPAKSRWSWPTASPRRRTTSFSTRSPG